MGQAIAITRQDHSAADLRRVAGGSRDGALVRRLLALVLEGCSRGEAARQNGMDRQALCDWVHRYETEGVGGLGPRRSPGRAPALRRPSRTWGCYDPGRDSGRGRDAVADHAGTGRGRRQAAGVGAGERFLSGHGAAPLGLQLEEGKAVLTALPRHLVAAQRAVGFRPFRPAA